MRIIKEVFFNLRILRPQHYFFRQQISDGLWNIHIKIQEQLADPYTKPLEITSFEEFRK